MIEGLFGRGVTVLERAMDIRMARQQLLASNVANIDTPGYRHLDVDFEQSLRQLMAHEDAAQASTDLTARGRSADDLTPPALKISGIDGLMIGPDSNSANLEILMGRVVENEIQYRIAAQFMGSRFNKLRTVLDTVAKS